MEPNNNQFLQLRSGQQFVDLFAKEISNYERKDVFGLVGVFGTREIGHDIDILTYPSCNRPKGEFVIAQNELLARVKEKLKKDYGSDLIPFPMLELQDEVEYLSQRQPGQVFLHNLIFTDLAAVRQRVPFLEAVIKSPKFEVLHGDINALEQSLDSLLDFYYFSLVNSNVTLSNYPLGLLSKKIQHIGGYAQKFALGQSLKTSNVTLSEEESKCLFYETLKMLDEKVKSSLHQQQSD